MLDRDGFWDLIDLLGGRADEDACERLTEVLAQQSKAAIIRFADDLAEALYRLDRRELADLPCVDCGRGGLPFEQSDDMFLFARCAAIAAGRDAYERVLLDPLSFAPYTAAELDGEPLLFVAPDAWESLTGREWDHEEPYDYETGSNPEGWPEMV